MHSVLSLLAIWPLLALAVAVSARATHDTKQHDYNLAVPSVALLGLLASTNLSKPHSSLSNNHTTCKRIARERATLPGLFLDPSRIFSMRPEDEEADLAALEWHRKALSAAHAANNTQAFADAVVLYLGSVVNASDPNTLAFLSSRLGTAMANFPPCHLNLPSHPKIVELSLCSKNDLIDKKHSIRGQELPPIHSGEDKYARSLGVVLFSLIFSSHGQDALLLTNEETFDMGGTRTSLYEEAANVEKTLWGAAKLEADCEVYSRINTMRKRLGTHHFLTIANRFSDIINGMPSSDYWTGRFLSSAYKIHKDEMGRHR